jgi:hypothetical protein
VQTFFKVLLAFTALSVVTGRAFSEERSGSITIEEVLRAEDARYAAQIGPTVDQRRLRAAERVSAEDVRVQSDARNPSCHEPRVLPCCHGPTMPGSGSDR